MFLMTIWVTSIVGSISVVYSSFPSVLRWHVSMVVMMKIMFMLTLQKVLGMASVEHGTC